MSEPKTRSISQNNRMWSMLRDLSRQVVWHGQKLEDTEWKDVLTAGLKRQRVVPGIEGGFVVLGSSTRRMTVKEMNELMEFAEFFGGTQNVRFSASPEMAETA